MDESEGVSNYRAYLLRCWYEADQWRYSLEKVGNGRRQGFASAIDLADYLCQLETVSKNNSSSDDQIRHED